MIDISQWRSSIGLWYYQICDNVIDKSLPALCRKGTRAKKQSSNEKHSQTNMNGTSVEQISSNEIPQYRANRRNRYSNPVLVVSNGQTPVVSINGKKPTDGQKLVALSNGLISNNNQKTVPSTDGKTVASTDDQTSVVLSSGQTSTNGKKQVALSDSQTPVPSTDGKTPVVSSDSQKQVALSNSQTPVVYSNSRLTSIGQKPLSNSQTPVTSTDGQTPVVYCNSQKPVALSSKGQKPVASSNNQEPVALSYCPNVRCSVGQTPVDGIHQTSINGQKPVALSNSSTANTTMRYADWCGRVQTISLAVFLFLLLILSGDIELNPGPKTGK